MLTNGKTLKFRAAKLKGFTVTFSSHKMTIGHHTTVTYTGIPKNMLTPRKQML